MSKPDRDHSLDTLLDLDGQVFVVDPGGKYWVKFKITRVDASPEKPHGLDYSLTLHDEKGQRLVGFDNAHPVRKSSSPAEGGGLARITDIDRGPSNPMNIPPPSNF